MDSFIRRGNVLATIGYPVVHVPMYSSATSSEEMMHKGRTTYPNLSTWSTPESLNIATCAKLDAIGELVSEKTTEDNRHVMSRPHSQDAVQFILNHRDSGHSTEMNRDKYYKVNVNSDAYCPLQTLAMTNSSGTMSSQLYTSLCTPAIANGSRIHSTLHPNCYINLIANSNTGGSQEIKRRDSYAEAVGCTERGPWRSNGPIGTCPVNAVNHHDTFVMNQAPSGSINHIPNPNIVLPAILARVNDTVFLTSHQAFLRQQIEVFAASSTDTSESIRGRHKAIHLGQVGVRCRHCAHVSPAQRAKGSTYYPISIQGFYQAGQNMCSTHLQCGLCTHMPDSITLEFSVVLAAKKTKSSGSGRVYWTRCAQEMDLVDTDHGVYYRTTVPYGVRIIDLDPNIYRSKSSKKRKIDS